MTLNVVGIVCALATEARHLGPGIRTTERVTSLPDGTLLTVSGMGCTAAASGARALMDAGASALASWGMAGGLDPALAPGAIFLPSEVIGPQGAALSTARVWRERLSVAVATHRPVAHGKLLTSSKAIGSVSDKAALFRETGAAAVDMESLAIAEMALTRDLPFIAVRVIVDSAHDALPRAVTVAADSAGHLRLWRLIGALARAPGDLAPLIRLARCYRAASRSLAAVARTGALAPHAFPVASGVAGS
ncbi:MAG: phosphorylase [Gammaproteobacteria bacterium]|nr:phosphorylase [Gammaproteobacteria bacterium]